MDLSTFVSKKLIATILCVALVAIADFTGAPLDTATMSAIQNMLLGLLGAQGMVDTAAAWKVGKAVASTVETIQDVVDADTDAGVEG